MFYTKTLFFTVGHQKHSASFWRMCVYCPGLGCRILGITECKFYGYFTINFTLV